MKLCMGAFLISLKLSVALFLFLLSSNLSYPSSSIVVANNNVTDYEALVCLKHQTSSSSNSLILKKWMNDTGKHFCSWEGVACGRKHSNRVTALNLSSIDLTCPLPTCIFNLTFLKILDLNNNSMYGEIPASLSHLRRLQFLNLANNSLHGEIPASLSRLRRLQILNLGNNFLQGALPTNLSSELISLQLRRNNFSGKIPSTFFFLPKLKYLGISRNNNIGKIPTSLGNLSSIVTLNMGGNNLEGSIPANIGSLKNLQNLVLDFNNLSGIIPSSIYNLSQLGLLSITDNHLSGPLSTNIAISLPQLEYLYLSNNTLSGSPIQALSNCTNIVVLELAINKLTGIIPPNLGNLKNLNSLLLNSNEFESDDVEIWNFFNSLANCTSLQILDLANNKLGGVLPTSICNLSIQLNLLAISGNHISGSIPSEIDKLFNLNLLDTFSNNLTGNIPNNIGKLKNLQELLLSFNRLTGAIPWSLANLTGLCMLDFSFNQLIGIIPLNIGNLSRLYYLNLEHNNLAGSIPKEIFGISGLSRYLALGDNQLNGELSTEVGKLISLNWLDLSRNKLTGMIPQSLGDCRMLTHLYLNMNMFYGLIPTAIGKLTSLEVLDLSQNNLSGTIPDSLENLSLLNLLNLSYNKFEGEVPNVGVFQNATIVDLHGNTKLCGGIHELHLRMCVKDSKNNKEKNRGIHHVLKILFLIIGIGALLIFISFAVIFYLYKYKIQHMGSNNISRRSSIEEPFPMISYAELVKATTQFSSSNLIGRGRYGSVYQGTLDKGQTIVAIKVFELNIQGCFRSFDAECNALRNIRHRNLVKVLTSCSTIDFNGKDFKALVFEFMPKGNLDTWIHREDGTHLQLKQRLNIIVNVADALEYLHHSCKPPIIHCDIKPGNILLDEDMVAHVGDFGLARILFESMSMTPQNSDSKSWLKGTIGYVPPEYGRGAYPSSSGDAYSFGIVLLEMLVGRRPTDDLFKDNLNLHNLVDAAYPHKLLDIVDPKILVEEETEAYISNVEKRRRENSESFIECLRSIAEVGLSCSVISPEQRLSMRDSATKLHAIRAAYLQSKHGDEEAKTLS